MLVLLERFTIQDFRKQILYSRISTHACDLVSEICRRLFLEMFINACSHVDMSLQEYLQKKVWKDKRLCLP